MLGYNVSLTDFPLDPMLDVKILAKMFLIFAVMNVLAFTKMP